MPKYKSVVEAMAKRRERKVINHIALVLDSSGSMRDIHLKAQLEAENIVRDIHRKSVEYNQESKVSIFTFSSDTDVIRSKQVFEESASLTAQRSAHGYYPFLGNGTHLYKTVLYVINELRKVNQNDGDDHAFLVTTITDGLDEGDYQSASNRNALIRSIQALQSEGNWTFTFAGPATGFAGSARKNLGVLGVPYDNITEWPATNEGVEQVSVRTQQGIASFAATRSTGGTRSEKFYTQVPDNVEANLQLQDVTNDYKKLRVKKECAIQPLVEVEAGVPYVVGRAYYELTKPEEIQGHKKVLLVHKKSGRVYGGPKARTVVGLDPVERAGQVVKVTPGNHGDYRVFVQSTSTNRKLVASTTVLWQK